MKKIVVYRPISMVFGLNADEFNSQLESEGEARIEQDNFPGDWPYLARTYRTFDTQEAADNFILENESPEISDTASPDKLYVDFAGKSFELDLTQENADIEDDDTGLYGYAALVYPFIRETMPDLEEWKAIVLAKAVAADDPWYEIEDFYTDSTLSPAWNAETEEITGSSGDCTYPFNDGCPRIGGQADEYQLATFIGFHIAAGVAQAEIPDNDKIDFDSLDFDFETYDSRAEKVGYFIVQSQNS